jgi:endonuclease G
MKSSVLFLAAALSALPLASVAAEGLPTSCPTEYADRTAPDLRNPKLGGRIAEVCFSQFGVFHSGITATPLFVGQRLTADLVAKAQTIDRNDVFKAETRLPASDRAELSHYRGSGFDRGHMAPAADMATDLANDESFSLANMVPQYSALNRGAWADIEETTRKLATRYGEVFVVTGPAFTGSKLARVGNRVFVPTSVYKAVYIPATGQTSAWWADNRAPGGMEVISIAVLAERIGADVFPSVPATAKATTVSLPLPKGVVPAKGFTASAGGSVDAGPVEVTAASGNARADATWFDWLITLFVEFLEALLRALLRG